MVMDMRSDLFMRLKQLEGLMESPSYIPNPLPPSSLFVLSSAAEAPSVPDRSSRHLAYSQVMDKNVYTVSSYGLSPLYRHMDGFANIAPHMIRMPPFGQPRLPLINPTGGGAFRPVLNPVEQDGHHHGLLPAKRAKTDDVPERTVSHTRVRSSFPESTVSVKQEQGGDNGDSAEVESLSTELSEGVNDSHSERSSPEEDRTLRVRRKKELGRDSALCCPVCGVTVRPGELESHLLSELDKLNKIARRGIKSRDCTPQGKKTPSTTLSGTSKKGKESSEQAEASNPETRYENFLKIKANRQSRLNAKAGKNKKRRAGDAAMCPICNGKIIGCPDELNDHVNRCLRKRTMDSDEDEAVDVEGEGFEEYEWAGQTRIRATSLIDGRLRDLGFQACHRASEAETEQDLNVDGDDNDTFGKPQYTEADIIPCTVDEPMEAEAQQALRGAMIGEEASRSPSHPERNRWSSEDSSSLPSTSGAGSAETNKNENTGALSSSEVIESLKAKLRNHEEELKRGEKFKCLICMETYTIPVASIQCWHVHCEECWLRTLGAKKLCPQCNLITSPQDLRRIYL